MGAFDTIDHNILLNRLSSRFGVTGLSLKWFRSYLTNRSQFAVRIGYDVSSKIMLHFGVPQGSVLRPLLCSLYVAPIADIRQHVLCRSYITIICGNKPKRHF